MTSQEIRMKLPKPLYLRSRESSGAMREAKVMKLGSQRAEAEEVHEG
ncbi:MAG: hypothetical protein J7J20_00800 [Desulfurococcales archaeon]|nr:hypothetical protein [Desulfurococcales archaeon]